MDLLKLLEPYNEDLDYAFKGMGITKKVSDNMPELIDIWVEVQKKHTEEIYGNPNHAVDRCNNCSNSVLKNLYRWRNIYRKKVEESAEKYLKDNVPFVSTQDQIEFKGVPQKEFFKTITLEGTKGKPEYFKEEGVKSQFEYHTKEEIINLKWPQFKTYCKEQGLSVKGKKRAELMKELGL